MRVGWLNVVMGFDGGTYRPERPFVPRRKQERLPAWLLALIGAGSIALAADVGYTVYNAVQVVGERVNEENLMRELTRSMRCPSGPVPYDNGSGCK